jgi:hypothetical protein
MKKIVVVLAILIPSSAFAQQRSTALDRVSVSLGQCIGSVEQRLDEIADLRKQLAVAQETIKALQEKAAPEAPKE